MRYARAIAIWMTATIGGGALGEELTPERIAVIRHEQDGAMKKVNDAHGNKGPADMDSDERLELAQQQSEATQKVLDQHQVDAKDFVTRTMRLSREEREEVQAASEALLKKEAADKKAAEEKDAAEKSETAKKRQEVTVQLGISDQSPVVLEGDELSPDERATAGQASVAGEDKSRGAAKKAAPSNRQRKKQRAE